jgi:hypothetical protein
MLLLYLSRVIFGQISPSDEIFSIRVHVLLVDRRDVTFKKLPCKIVRSSRCPSFKAFPNATSIRVCDGDQEVRGGLTIGGFESEIDEVLAGETRRPKIYHAAFIDETDLVEEITHALGSLMGGKGSGNGSDFRCNA